MAGNFADRLIAAIQKKNTPAFVGIDPVYGRLPATIRENRELNDESDMEAAADAVYEYGTKLIKAVAPHVAGVKINVAFFEPYLWEGLEVFHNLLAEARAYDLITIADIKRGDVGHSAERYAAAHSADLDFVQLDSSSAADAITVNGYFGQDCVWPFVQQAAASGRGVFVLVRTSNPSAVSIQDLPTVDGKTVAEHMAMLTGQWAAVEGLSGLSGYSSVGGVVGCADAGQVERIRAAMPNSFMLVPGYGTQGLGIEQIRPYFKSDGLGAIVSSSRSIIYAYEDEARLEAAGGDWEKCVAAAAEQFKNELARALPAVQEA